MRLHIFVAMFIMASMRGKLVFTIVFLMLVAAGPVRAIVDPTAVPNNRFGIHISNGDGIEDAAALVNSSGGRYGYVTLVIQDTDRDRDKWQGVFDALRRHELIPLVRLATHVENGVWVKPQLTDVGNWVGFLNSLNWVIQNRYVILFNEPNHAKEWGGSISPEEYVQLVQEFETHLKRANENFFVLPAGFDGAADSSAGTVPSDWFFDRMYAEDERIFGRFDGWTSHSYPNPGFAGAPGDRGKRSIRGYQWELAYLSKYGLSSEIPVFVTETGWWHSGGVKEERWRITPERAATYFQVAFADVWVDQNLVAVTPFLLNYQDEPFDHFSWKRLGDDGFYPQYEVVQQMPKVAGQPVQISDSVFHRGFIPGKLLAESRYEVVVEFENTGQTIWTPEQTRLRVASSLPQEQIEVQPVPYTEPGEIAAITVDFSLPALVGDYDLLFRMHHENESFGQLLIHTFEIVSHRSLPVKIQLWLQELRHGEHFDLLSLRLKQWWRAFS